MNPYHGLNVQDVDTEMTFRVRPAHRTKAVQKDANDCVIYHALMSQGYDDVIVNNEVALLKKGDTWLRYFLPEELQEARKGFDTSVNGFFPCGDFKLNPAPASKRLGARKGQQSGTNRRGGGGNNGAKIAQQVKQRQESTRKPVAPQRKTSDRYREAS